jgi:hypothetical protein
VFLYQRRQRLGVWLHEVVSYTTLSARTLSWLRTRPAPWRRTGHS